MEQKLYNWYLEVKKANLIVTAKMVKNKAIELTSCPDFIASKGWLDKFKIRHNLELQ